MQDNRADSLRNSALAPPDDGSAEDAGKIVAKLTWRLVVPLAALLFFNSIDRINISFAALRRLLRSTEIWATAACWFALMSGAYGLIYWLPQVITQMSAASALQAGLLSALPWVAAGIGMLVNSWHSDRTGERHWHVGLAAVASRGCMALSLFSGGGALAMLFLTLSGFAFGAAQSTFWTIPPMILGAAAAATGVAFINMFGNSAGVVGPLAIGWLRERTGSFDAAIALLAAVLVAGGIALLWLRPRQRRGTLP